MMIESPICNSPIVVVLGAPNSPTGELSSIAQGRIDRAIDLVFEKDDSILLLTGGYGNFNSAPRPHSEYLREYALFRGVPDHRILIVTESSSTLEDAAYARDLLEDLGHEGELFVVTSDFHERRTHIVFTSMFPDRTVRIVPTSAEISPIELEVIVTHETNALEEISMHGGVIPSLYQIKLARAQSH